MSARKVIVSTKEHASKYEVRIEYGSRLSCGPAVRKVVGERSERAIVVSNKTVFDLYGKDVIASLKKAGFRSSVHLIGDGERYKNLKTFSELLAGFSSAGIGRTDVVIALGGGVVGDVAGFAAATHLRGVPYVQMPTTLLSMIDSSVGGKTGINTPKGKNLVGAFYHPKAVLIDPAVLSTLPNREFTAGLCEAVKQGAIAGERLLDGVASILDRIDAYSETQMTGFLRDQVSFKASIVAGDERESADDQGPRSRKILNFGHTFAHSLELATNYKYLRHGEAVGHGILFAAELSKKLGILDGDVVNLLRGAVHRCGNLPKLDNIDNGQIFDAFQNDKKVVNGSLNWILLEAIGKPVIVPHTQIGNKLVKATIAEFTS